MESITLSLKNHVYLNVDCDMGLMQELSDFLTFEVPGYKYMPLYKAGVWDGRVRLVDMRFGTVPAGMLSNIKEFCDSRKYELLLNDSPYGVPGEQTNILPEDVVEFVRSLNIHSKGEPLELRDYQLATIYTSLKKKRLTIISPTASGKSYIIYCILRWLIDNHDYSILITVPTTNLVLQMINDFKDYSSHNGWDVDQHTYGIMGGYEKKNDTSVVVSTWQSARKMNNSWFNKFDCILIDETQSAASKELQGILEKCTDVSYRFGTTGTLSNTKTHAMMIQAMIGPIYKVTSTKKLMEEGHISDININCIVLNYSKETKSITNGFKKDYQKEVDFICQHEKRNKFIRNLACSLEGNTLILFNFIEKHGDVLHKLLVDKLGDSRKCFYITGDVKAEIREDFKEQVKRSKNAIILASYGTFQAGQNIPNIDNVIFASPSKSEIRVLQSIGRGLRKSEGKTHMNLYDIADDLTTTKTKKNITYHHMVERLNMYTKEQFKYKITKVELE